MDRLQLDKNAKLTGRVYFKDEVMWLGLSGSGASFTFDGTKLVEFCAENACFEAQRRHYRSGC